MQRVAELVDAAFSVIGSTAIAISSGMQVQVLPLCPLNRYPAQDRKMTDTKIQLLVDLPVDKRHGAFMARTFDVIRIDDTKSRGYNGAWFLGDSGEECKALTHEYVVVEDNI